MDFDFGVILQYWPLFIKGLLVTIQVSALGVLLGTGLGIVILLIRQCSVWPARWFANIYLSFFRGTPVIVLAFFVYYALPGLLGLDISAYWAGVLALGLNSSAFISEILRSGLSSIPRGQFEAGNALGLNSASIWRYVILPQVFRTTLPPLTNEFIILIKATPALSVITLVELTRTAQIVMNQTFRPMEAFMAAAILYFCLLFTLSNATRYLEHRIKRASR